MVTAKTWCFAAAPWLALTHDGAESDLFAADSGKDPSERESATGNLKLRYECENLVGHFGISPDHELLAVVEKKGRIVIRKTFTGKEAMAIASGGGPNYSSPSRPMAFVRMGDFWPDSGRGPKW